MHVGRNQKMKIYKISSKTVFTKLEEDVKSINSFWPRLSRGQKINPSDFSIGGHHFTSINDAIDFLRATYKLILLAQEDDLSNYNLYDGWKRNVHGCANILKRIEKDRFQLKLFEESSDENI